MTEPKFGAYVASLDAGFRQGDATADAKREEAANIRLIQDAVLAIGSGDLGAVGELLADDVRLEIHSSEELPFIRSAGGKPDFLNAVRHNFGKLRTQRPTVEAVVAQGDTVVVVSREEGGNCWRPAHATGYAGYIDSCAGMERSRWYRSSSSPPEGSARRAIRSGPPSRGPRLSRRMLAGQSRR